MPGLWPRWHSLLGPFQYPAPADRYWMDHLHRDSFKYLFWSLLRKNALLGRYVSLVVAHVYNCFKISWLVGPIRNKLSSKFLGIPFGWLGYAIGPPTTLLSIGPMVKNDIAPFWWTTFCLPSPIPGKNCFKLYIMIPPSHLTRKFFIFGRQHFLRVLGFLRIFPGFFRMGPFVKLPSGGTLPSTGLGSFLGSFNTLDERSSSYMIFFPYFWYYFFLKIFVLFLF